MNMIQLDYIFNNEAKQLFLNFSYERDVIIGATPDNYKLIPVGVECTLFTDREGTLTAGLGQSFCHPSDNFNKMVGRKIAFERAVISGFPDKHERRAIWNAYVGKVRV